MIGGIIGYKKEMSRIQVDGKMIPVTLVKIDTQYIIGYKTIEKDGYNAVIIGVGRKEYKNKNDKKLFSYSAIKEFKVDEEWMLKYKIGDIIDDGLICNENISIVGLSKGKGFSGIMKRFNAKGGPKTHGSKFHRQVGSMGNRKPRRVMKGHPHAGRMGNNRITVKDVKVYTLLKDKENILVVKGSLPGSYNSRLYINLG